MWLNTPEKLRDPSCKPIHQKILHERRPPLMMQLITLRAWPLGLAGTLSWHWDGQAHHRARIERRSTSTPCSQNVTGCMDCHNTSKLPVSIRLTDRRGRVAVAEKGKKHDDDQHAATLPGFSRPNHRCELRGLCTPAPGNLGTWGPVPGDHSAEPPVSGVNAPAANSGCTALSSRPPQLCNCWVPEL